MKVLRCFLPLLAVVSLFSGCLYIEQHIDLTAGSEEGYVTTRLEVDRSFVGAEMDIFFDSLALSVPALNTDAVHRRFETTRDFSELAVYEWEGKVTTPGDWTLQEKPDGSFEFRYLIQSVDSLSQHAEESQVLLKITVWLPQEIDFANTMDTTDHEATWHLTKTDLLTGVELRALTLAP